MRVIALVLATCVLSATVSHAQVPDFTPQTPLLAALLHNDLVEARRLIERGADPNEGHFVSMPPVLLAIVRQDAALVKLMVAKGADVNVRDRSGSTALMWAAFNETGDATLVEELLKMGADPSAANQAGETALVWAMRRGETPAVLALRHATAPSTAAIAASSEKAIALLQRSSAQFQRVSGCYSCHHTSLPLMAVGAARAHGLRVDEDAARQQAEGTLAVLTSVHEQARTNRDRIPDPAISVSYALIGVAAQQFPRSELTDTMARVIAAWQGEDGAFAVLPAVRPPIEADAFTATALSLRALQLYGTRDDLARVERASRWLRTAAPRTNQERAMQLLGLAWANAPTDSLRAPIAALLATQQPDGGWSQLPGLETDAYATGQALVALQTAGHAVSSPEYRRGVAFLLRTQFPDGSWLVRTRTFPVQPPKDSGFPHGKHQWISAAGTSWATLALSVALPPRELATDAAHGLR